MNDKNSNELFKDYMQGIINLAEQSESPPKILRIAGETFLSIAKIYEVAGSGVTNG